jgi:hypothetical protein
MGRVLPISSSHPSDDEGPIKPVTKDITKDTNSDEMGKALGKVATDMMELI